LIVSKIPILRVFTGAESDEGPSDTDMVWTACEVWTTQMGLEIIVVADPEWQILLISRISKAVMHKKGS